LKQKRNELIPETSPDGWKKEAEFAPGEELLLGSEFAARHAGQTEPENPAARIDRSKADQPASVEALQDVIGLITAPEIVPEAAKEVKRQRELNEVVHNMLVLGLGLSTAVMCMGITLSFVFHNPLPSTASTLKQVIKELHRLSPSSFLSLGILLLIATPILRVFGSLIEFIITRDWQYAAITLLVLIILAISILAGRGQFKQQKGARPWSDRNSFGEIVAISDVKSAAGLQWYRFLAFG
jgi:uncharacterized membrane protein